jgi:protein-S-isoprenylcysteine O-methyltransferase Ste14
VLGIVDEFDEPLGRKLIRQPLHALTAGGSHPGDLRHGERTKQREASQEAEPGWAASNRHRNAGVIARPPLLFLAALVIGFVLDRLVRLPFPVPGIDLVHWIIGGSLILIGLALAAAGLRNFSRARTPFLSIKPTRALVTTGIHGWTRNPIYLGMFLVYGGIGVATQSAWILILALPLAITIRLGVVAREEAYLERRFGDAYRDYKARVRRWL